VKTHVWQAVVARRRIRGCPFCTGRLVSPETSLSAVLPELAAQWHPTKNGSLKPDQVFPQALRTAWWKCPEGPDHEWCTEIKYRGAPPGRGCPFCVGRRWSITNALTTVLPAIARQWHPTKNGSLQARDVRAHDSKPYWWLCPSGHSWKAPPGRRLHRGRSCPLCRLRKRTPAVVRRVREVVWLPSDFG
jgi:hypothetical protein